MKVVLSAVFLLLASQVMCSQICQPPKSESVFYLTSSMSDFYVANDFDQGKVFIAFGPDASGDVWCIVDIVSGYTYLNTPHGCTYQPYTDEQNAVRVNVLQI